MSRRERDKPFRFNPYSEAFQQDPYPVYSRLRAEAPFHRMMGTRVLTRYDDVTASLRDRRFSSKLFEETIWKNKPDFGAPDPDPIKSFIRKSIVFTENPDHKRLRHLTNACFLRRGLEDEEAATGLFAQVIDDVLRAAAQKDSVDAVEDIAGGVAMGATAGRIGLSLDAVPELARWVNHARQLLDPGPMTADDYHRAHEGMSRMLEVMEARRDQAIAEGEENLVTSLRARERNGDRLDEREIALTMIMTFIAGTETTKALISNAIHLLLQHPDQLEVLRGDPNLLPALVDEVLRFESPLQQTKRVALEDVTLDSGTVSRGEQVLLCLGAANRDPEWFEDPDRFDIRRANSSDHIAFGYGMRACLGAPMASIVTEMVIARLFLSDCRIRPLSDDRRWQSESRILRCLEALPVAVELRQMAKTP